MARTKSLRNSATSRPCANPMAAQTARATGQPWLPAPGGWTCKTPCTLKAGRKDEFSVTVTKPGYDPQTVDVKTRVAGAGMATDAISGATLEHRPNPINVTLYPLGKTPKPEPVPEPEPVAREEEATAAVM